jgi:hypothetical protein
MGARSGLRRRFAAGLLRAVVRCAPAASRLWAEAMLRELEFVESDWGALWWALGGTTAILRHSGRELLVLCWTYSKRIEERAMEQMGKKVGLGVAGAVGAVAVMLAAFGLLYLTAVSFPALGLDRAEWAHFLVAIVLPGIALAIVTVLLWRKKRPVAVGIMLSGAVMVTHLAVHFAGHFHGR